MRWRKRDIGRRLTVSFWDHVERAAEPMLTEADGQLVIIKPNHIVLQWWRYAEMDDADGMGVILRSTIVKREWLD